MPSQVPDDDLGEDLFGNMPPNVGSLWGGIVGLGITLLLVILSFMFS